MKTNKINRDSQSLVRRVSTLRAKATGLVASVALGAMALGLTAHAAAGMYRPATNSEGGVQAASIITENTITSSNATLSWYGMHGWYTVEGTTNFPAGPWVALGTVAATNHNGSLTVTNPFWPAPATFRLKEANSFVGQGACSGCHGDKYTEWSGTAHASALSSLQNIHKDTDPTCVVCHTVGFGQQTGFIDNTTTPHLANVGCENCHGPAGWHKYSDHDLIRPAVSLDPKICGGCHQDSHHPTYEEYETSPHAEVLDDIKYGLSGGVYYADTLVIKGTNSSGSLNIVTNGTPGSTNCYGYYVTTNADLSLKTNQTTGLIHSQNGSPAYVYDPGQDRAVGCGICHSAASRMAMLNDYEARQAGRTNALVLAAPQDAAAWGAACATCHDPHSAEENIQSTSIVSTTNVVTTTNIFSNYGKYYTNIVSATNVTTATNIVLVPHQLRNPMRSTKYYTMATTADKRTVITTNYSGVKATNVYFMSAAFANMYDPTVQICAQCHNSRGARWDGRSFGYYKTNNLQSVTTNGPGIVWGVQTNSSLSRPPHHSVQYNVLVGILQDDYLHTNAFGVATNYGSSTSGPSRHGAGISSSNGSYNTNGCATCHVPIYDVDANTKVTGHTFALDTKGCALGGCHLSGVPNIEEFQTTQANSIARVVALLNQWATTKAPDVLRTNYGALAWEYTTAGVLGNPTANSAIVGPPAAYDSKKPASVTNANLQAQIPTVIQQARFNLYMVQHDGSFGVHNPRYVPFLLSDAESKVAAQFPVANFKASKTIGFTNLTTVFTALGVGLTNWSWNFGDGNFSTLASPTNTYAAVGKYTVTLTATDTNGVTETFVRTAYIDVYDGVVANFVASVTNGSVPLTVTFTNLSANAETFSWSFALGKTNGVTPLTQSINGTDNATCVYTNAGTYSVTLRATSLGGSVTKTNLSYITVTP